MASNAFVSLSGTQPTPSLIVEEEEEEESPLKVSLSPQSSGSFPIRAPLSYDSDIENPVENNGDFSSGSEGFVSGEEGFESASERPFVADLDEEIVEIAMEEEDAGVPFVSGDEVEEEIAPFVDSVVGSSSPKTARPIAQLSLDDDDVVVDEGLVSEVEDDGASGVVRVSGVGAEETPKVEVFGGEEGKEDVGLLGKDSSVIVESEIGENGNPETGILGTEEKEPSSETILAELVEDKVLIIDESPIEPLVSSKEDSLPENAKLDDVNASPAVEEIPVPTENRALEMSALNEEVVEEKRSEVLVDDHTDDHTVSMNPTTEVDSVVYADQPIEVVEKSSVSSSGISEASPVIEELNDSKLVEADNVSSSIGGSVLSSGTDEASPVIEELNDSKLVEADNVSSSIGGNLVVETKEPVLLETGVVEAVKENGVSEAKRVEFQDEGSMSLGSAGSDQASPLVEESVGAENNGDGVGEIISLEQDNYNEKTELVIEQQINSSAQGNELKLAANGVESEPNSEVDGKDEIHAVEEGRAEAEAKSQVLIADEPQNSDDSIGDGLEEEGISNKSHTPEIVILSSFSDKEAKLEAEEEVTADPDEEEVDEGSVSDEDEEGLVFGSSQTAEQFIKELERGSGASSHSGAESSQDRSQRIDGQIVTDSDEADTDEEGDGKELFDSAALAALLKAATGAGSDSGNITITSPDGSRLFSIERPVGLGPSLRSLKPAPRPNRSNLFTPSDLTAGGEMESDNNLSEEERKKLEKVQLLRVKFLRLVQRLGHSPEDSIASQVLYRLVLAAGRHTSQAFSLETAKRTAMQLEAEKADLDFSLNVLVLGKAGVGKSATINSIFGEEKALIDAFEPGTIDVKEIAGTLDGVNIRVFDTPGLRSSAMEQNFNQKILSSIKKFTKKCPPDIVLYVDRLDTQTRDLNDLPLLKTITSTLGSSIWRSAIVTLTHAASAPPDGPSGSPLSYEVFVSQRSHVVQQSIGQAVGDLRLMNPSLMNPVSLVENHPSCRKNREGERILPNGQIWRPQLLFLCYSMKILSEASSLSKPQDPFDHRKLFGFRVRSPPLPYLLSSLLQSRAHPKLSAEQGGENGDSDIDLGDFSDSDQEEEEDEYDQLPPFKPLRKSQLAKLSKEQRKAYFDEYDYRVKLLQKKQLREEVKRLREIKKKGKDSVDDYGYMGEDVDQENDSPAAVPVPLPDMALPPSFDGDNPAYRYRFLEPTSQLLARPVLDTHGWDHDCGYDGVSLEQNLAIASRFPAGIAVQITKDKKEFNIHLDSSVAAKHGENGSTMAGFDIQNIGKQLAYIVKGETKFKNLKKNKTAAGISITFLGENVVPGLKIEDQIALGKRLVLVGSTGAVRSQGDVAYGANLEARLKEKDFPIGQDQSTLGLSLMKWRGDLALGANLQSQFSIGRSSKMAIRVGLNNKLSGQITVKTSSSEQLQIALMGVLPIAISIFRSIWPGAGETYSAY